MQVGDLGIRPMRGLNSASMAKLGWRMIRQPDVLSLWVRVLKHKYCKGGRNVDIFKTSHNPSNAWKGICESKWILDKGIMHTIENGHQTLFWRHRWVAEQPLAEMANQPVSEETQDQTVAKHWQPVRVGGWERLRDYS